MDSDSTMWVIIGVVILLLVFVVVIVGVGCVRIDVCIVTRGVTASDTESESCQCNRRENFIVHYFPPQTLAILAMALGQPTCQPSRSRRNSIPAD